MTPQRWPVNDDGASIGGLSGGKARTFCIGKAAKVACSLSIANDVRKKRSYDGGKLEIKNIYNKKDGKAKEFFQRKQMGHKSITRRDLENKEPILKHRGMMVNTFFNLTTLSLVARRYPDEDRLVLLKLVKPEAF